MNWLKTRRQLRAGSWRMISENPRSLRSRQMSEKESTWDLETGGVPVFRIRPRRNYVRGRVRGNTV